MNGSTKDGRQTKNERNPLREQEIQNGSSTAPEIEKSEDATREHPSKNRNTTPKSKNQVSEIPKVANDSASWLNWFSKSDIATEDKIRIVKPEDATKSADENRPRLLTSEALQDAPTSHKQRRNSEPSPGFPEVQQEEATRSWLSLWGNASTQTKGSSSASATGIASTPKNDSIGTELRSGKLGITELSPVSAPQPPQHSANGAKSSYGWAFWSREQPKSDDDKTYPESEVGELALAGSSSQSKPESAVVDEARGVPYKVGKRQRPQTLEVPEDSKKPWDIGDDAKKDPTPETVPLAPKIKSLVDADSKAKRVPENLLLPHFRSTYNTVGRPSLIQQISRLLQLSSPLEPKHVEIVQNPLRVKRALAIVSLTQPLSRNLIHMAYFDLCRVFMAISPHL